MLQIAVDGAWEDAATLPLPASVDDATALFDAAAARTTDVAVEILWTGSPVVFAGLRGDPTQTRERVAQLATTPPAGPREALVHLAGLHAPRVVGAELGAVNAWRSVGPLTIPLGAGAEAVRHALAGRPDLAACAKAVALELRYDFTAGEAWIGIEVSTMRGDGVHIINAERVAALLRQAVVD